MIELVVVVVILTILAAAIAPRLMQAGSRRADGEITAVVDLVSAAARRDSLSSQRIALDFNAETQGQPGRLRVMGFFPPPPTDPFGQSEWREDLLIPGVNLENTVLQAASADGVEVDPRKFRIELKQSIRRPELMITLAVPSSGMRWTIRLASGAARATVGDATALDATGPAGSIDLDANGRSEDPW